MPLAAFIKHTVTLSASGAHLAMYYGQLAQVYDAIEKASGSLEKIDLFAEILKEAEVEDVDKIVVLTIGKLHPDWKGEPEIGIAEKMAVQVVATAAGIHETVVLEQLRKSGDIGVTAEELLAGSVQETLFAEEPTIAHVYNTLNTVARASGSGSNKEKIANLVGLVTDGTPLEAKYILRTVTGQLRLGLGDMGIIDALAVAFTGSRDSRPEIERAYNFCSDIGRVACLLADVGIEAIREVKAKVGTPIRMMAAKKLSDPAEIMEKTGARALVEYKYDGERVQIHKSGNEVILFSRRQEQITNQYPDVVQLVQSNVIANDCILEAECVAINPETGTMRPFQELMRRRRKTDIMATMKEVPVALFFFDVLFVDGVDLTSLPMLERRKKLEKVVSLDARVSLTVGEVTEDPERLDAIFMEALGTGHEGVIAKAVHKDSIYQAGSRSWLWIKLKASYKEGMSDSVDLVIVGAFHGRGKRTGVYGAILASVYDDDSDTFPTVCKIGTGFTDEMLEEFKARLDEHLIESRNPKVVSDIKPDVWFEPVEVIEVLGDEITISPIHPAGRGRVLGSDGGLAIRFPRFTGRWRDDKGPTQATTVSDFLEAFEKQALRFSDSS